MQMYEAEMYEPEPRLIQAVKAGRTAELKRFLAEGIDVNVRSPHGSSSALHIAALNGYRGMTSTLLNYGADENAVDDAGQTPLMKAAQYGHLAVVEALLKAGARVNILANAFNSAYGRSFGGAALHFAVSSGHHGIVLALLSHGANANPLDDRGYTPLTWAILTGSDLSIVKTLLKAGADLNIRSAYCNGCTALHLAASSGNSDASAVLLRNGADTDVRDEDGDTPLVWASRSGHLAVVETLVKAGANLDIRSTDEDGVAALHAAAFEGYNRVVEVLLENGADKDVLNNHGETPLSRAASGGHLRVVDTLLEFNANSTIATTRDLLTPLHIAVHLGRQDIVSSLLEWGASTLETDIDGETPLVWAARDGKARLVEMMMAERTAFGDSSTDGCFALQLATKHGRDAVVSALLQGTNKDAFDCNGETPLTWAVAGGHVPMVEALLKAGINVNGRRGTDGCAALHLAAGGGHDEIVSTLLRKGAYKDILDNKGTTPLLWATAEGHLAVVETLLAAGTNFNIRSKEDGFTALQIAAGNGHHGVVSALLRSGAESDVVDPNGDTALMWAAGNGHVRVVETLLAVGADVTIRNSVEGYSALDWATKGRHVGVQEVVRRRLADVNADDENEGGCTDMNLDSCTDQVDATQAMIEEEFNFGHQEQTETVERGSLTEGGGESFRRVLAVPGWLDVEGVCLGVVLFLWFSARCKLRS